MSESSMHDGIKKRVDDLTNIRTKSGDVPDNSEKLGDGTEITAKLGDSTNSAGSTSSRTLNLIQDNHRGFKNQFMRKIQKHKN